MLPGNQVSVALVSQALSCQLGFDIVIFLRDLNIDDLSSSTHLFVPEQLLAALLPSRSPQPTFPLIAALGGLTTIPENRRRKSILLIFAPLAWVTVRSSSTASICPQ